MSEQKITKNAKMVKGVALDCMEETGKRGGVQRWWRRADRRENESRIVSTWDRSQRAALAR